MTFNLAERIKQVRMLEAKIDEEEKALAVKHKPLKDWAVKARADIMAYLNETGQKSASTVNGTTYWSTKVTYRVTDKDEWRRHVIGTEAWEQLSWATAPAIIEERVQSGDPVPPGLFRNAVNILYINPPPKPRKKVVGKEEDDGGDGAEPQPEAAE
jgi:hypothetical protein